jgi:NAD-reducing hydrogenase small subunit
MRNNIPVKTLLQSIYIDRADTDKGIPTDIPVLLKHAVPLHDVIKIDLHVPGCPPSAASILFVLNELLDGRVPDLRTKLRFG